MLELLSFLLTALLATLLTPLVIQYYKRKNWLDEPEKKRHVKVTHTTAVPRGGGLVIFLSIVFSSLLLLNIDQYLLAILFGAALLAIVGMLDDIYDIHPLIRLTANTIAALIVVGSGIGIAYVSHPFQEGVIHLDQPQISFWAFGAERTIWLLSSSLAVLFIIWNMNIVNWSKGVDGQMPGFVMIALIFIGILSTRFIGDPTEFNTMMLSFITAGAFGGFLLWNWYPQKIMPGYGAGSLAGYFLSVLAILSGAKVATALMVLALPTADAVFTIIRRIRAGKSPIWGDRGHFHHKLIDVFHWSKQQVAVFYWSVSLIMGVVSLYVSTLGKLVAIAITFGLTFGVLIWAKIKQLRHDSQ
ncbi:MAG: MraY family glycosyltransferase [Patescibacteria group bacterium]